MKYILPGTSCVSSKPYLTSMAGVVVGERDVVFQATFYRASDGNIHPAICVKNLVLWIGETSGDGFHDSLKEIPLKKAACDVAVLKVREILRRLFVDDLVDLSEF